MPPRSGPSLALAGELRRDSLFRHEYLSDWNGGGFLRGHLPFACPLVDSCLLSGTLYLDRNIGSDVDYPTRLVAGRDEMGADVSLQAHGSGLNGSLVVTGTSRRYHDPRLEPAGVDTLGASFRLDAAVQLHADIVRSLFAGTGPSGQATSNTAETDRDSTILSALLGFRIGDPSSGDILQLRILGGIAAPFLDTDQIDVDPQLVLDISLAIENEDPAYADSSISLRIGGRRETQASPRDFLVQSNVQSYLDFYFRTIDSPAEGIEYRVLLYYDMLEHMGALGPAESLDISRVGGGMSVRFLLEEWLGFDIANWTVGLATGNTDYEVSNQFLLSLFIPFGGYGFELEEPAPW
jgi:hypothetical protein